MDNTNNILKSIKTNQQLQSGEIFITVQMWTEARKRGFTLQDVIRLMAVGPAKLARLDKRKGRIEVCT